MELHPKTLLKLLQSMDAFRKPQRFTQFLLSCKADARGRLGSENKDYPQMKFLERIRKAAAGVSAKPLVVKGLTGSDIASAMQQERLLAIASAKRAFK
jgi:tRNA nucleotidyltransferase (CCA-adding enzyme)